jgi:hypothetical protein
VIAAIPFCRLRPRSRSRPRPRSRSRSLALRGGMIPPPTRRVAYAPRLHRQLMVRSRNSRANQRVITASTDVSSACWCNSTCCCNARRFRGGVCPLAGCSTTRQQQCEARALAQGARHSHSAVIAVADRKLQPLHSLLPQSPPHAGVAPHSVSTFLHSELVLSFMQQVPVGLVPSGQTPASSGPARDQGLRHQQERAVTPPAMFSFADRRRSVGRERKGGDLGGGRAFVGHACAALRDAPRPLHVLSHLRDAVSLCAVAGTSTASTSVPHTSRCGMPSRPRAVPPSTALASHTFSSAEWRPEPRSLRSGSRSRRARSRQCMRRRAVAPPDEPKPTHTYSCRTHSDSIERGRSLAATVWFEPIASVVLYINFADVIYNESSCTRMDP